ncbi:hypothetical protein [Occultella kanbiaonis]|uniref:hypothetical protein n=1 Tax=Occultella kanbiaonis TaxID=2675754 RepID=UPI0013D58CAA|nr:hypothetical protein [Occultella kanbiaonis]
MTAVDSTKHVFSSPAGLAAVRARIGWTRQSWSDAYADAGYEDGTGQTQEAYRDAWMAAEQDTADEAVADAERDEVI